MKKLFIPVFILAIVSMSAFGFSDETIAEWQIYAMLNQINGTMSLPSGGTYTSPGNYLVRGTGIGNTERIAVYVTNNVLGVVSVAVTDTGTNAKLAYDIYHKIINKEFILQNLVTGTNSMQGTLIRSTGRKYGFSLEYTSHSSQQMVMVFTRQ